ncbi:hypothetical protein Tco_0996337, partial [Tanacetum coccineum]
MKDSLKHSFSEQPQTYSSQRHRQGSRTLLEDVLVGWDGYQLVCRWNTLKDLLEQRFAAIVGYRKKMWGMSSHVTNVPPFDVDDFSSWKDRFLVYLDCLEPYLLEILENRLYVPKYLASTSKNVLIKPQKQWSHKDKKLANQDKRLKSITISCLPNDVMKSVIKYITAKSMWNGLILSHDGPSDTRDTKIAALRLKFNAFKALEGEKESDSDVEEDTRSSSEFLADLNADALKAELALLTKKIDVVSKNKSEIGLVAESFNWDEEIYPLRMMVLPRLKHSWLSLRMSQLWETMMLGLGENSPSHTAPEVTSNTKSECDNQEPLPPLLKLLRTKPIGTSNDF